MQIPNLTPQTRIIEALIQQIQEEVVKIPLHD